MKKTKPKQKNNNAIAVEVRTPRPYLHTFSCSHLSFLYNFVIEAS